jgi:phosphotransferase system HPr (HPr) family protein
MTVTREMVVTNKTGLHARPAATFVKTVSAFKSKITLENLDRGTPPVNAKSILSVLGAGVQKSHRIRLSAEGSDELAALDALHELILTNCGEAE